MANFQQHTDVLPNGNSILYSDTIPSALGSGITSKVGDVCINTSLTNSGATYSWTCVTAGSPGVWVASGRGTYEITFGPLGASNTSGAFVLPGGTWRVASVRAVASVKAGTGATVTVEHLTGTTAPGSGTAQLTAALIIDTTYTANTVLTGTMISPVDSMAGGTDRMGVVLAGTLTGLANLYVTVVLQKIS
jgi:hypothetical protein